MLYARRPGMPLAQFVDRIWYCDGYCAVHRQERVLPNGTFQLIVDMRVRLMLDMASVDA